MSPWWPPEALAVLSLLPLMSAQRDLGPKAVGTWVWGTEGTAMEPFRESHAGREINTKISVFGSLASLGWTGEGPSRRGGRQVSSEGQTGQQVASTGPHSGVASYQAGIWLGFTGWFIASDGRGQHGVRLHKSSPINETGGKGPQSTAQQLVIILLWL